MKTFFLLLVIFVGFSATSCQSEYSERMDKALKLKKSYLDLKQKVSKTGDEKILIQLSNIEKEIKVQALISGNEETFLKEIWTINQ